MVLKIEIDYLRLKERCQMREEEFFNLPGFSKIDNKRYQTDPVESDGTKINKKFSLVSPEDDWYLFQDNGANILAVAHLDNVNPATSVKGFGHVNYRGTNNEKRVYCPQFDDRLGAYILLDLLPGIFGGTPYDILLTTNEEIGMSTARNFLPPAGKDYNWMVEFDRRGEDVVFYDYENPDWRAAFLDAGFRVGSGSFSDVAALKFLRICGVNIGVGYHDEHSKYAYMIENELIPQLEKFYRFFMLYKDTKFPFDPAVHKRTYTTYQSGWTSEWNWQDRTWSTYNSPASGRNQKPGAKVHSLPPTTSTLHREKPAQDDVNDELYDLYSQEFDEQLEGVDFDRTTFKDAGGSTFVVYSEKKTKTQYIRCSKCLTPYDIEDVMWSRIGSPVCTDCMGSVVPSLAIQMEQTVQRTIDRIHVILANNAQVTLADFSEEQLYVLPEVLEDDELEWLEDAGGITTVLEDGVIHHLRVPSWFTKEDTVICDVCGECDYKEETITFTTQDGAKQVCRWCVVKE